MPWADPQHSVMFSYLQQRSQPDAIHRCVVFVTQPRKRQKLVVVETPSSNQHAQTAQPMSHAQLQHRCQEGCRVVTEDRRQLLTVGHQQLCMGHQVLQVCRTAPQSSGNTQTAPGPSMPPKSNFSTVTVIKATPLDEELLQMAMVGSLSGEPLSNTAVPAPSAHATASATASAAAEEQEPESAHTGVQVDEACGPMELPLEQPVSSSTLHCRATTSPDAAPLVSAPDVTTMLAMPAEATSGHQSEVDADVNKPAAKAAVAAMAMQLETELADLRALLPVASNNCPTQGLQQQHETAVAIMSAPSSKAPQRVEVKQAVHSHLLCAICRELVVAAHNLRCGHLFCGPCLAAWLRRKKDCPTCRRQVTCKCFVELNPVCQHDEQQSSSPCSDSAPGIAYAAHVADAIAANLDICTGPHGNTALSYAHNRLSLHCRCTCPCAAR